MQQQPDILLCENKSEVYLCLFDELGMIMLHTMD